MTDGTKAALWLVGAMVVVMLLEFLPRIGGAVLILLLAYFAVTLQRKGTI